MKRTAVSTVLGITHPILQAGLPWISNPELVAAVSNAGGLGILNPNTGFDLASNFEANFRANLRRVQRLTQKPFGVALYLPDPNLEHLIEAAAQEGMHIAITYGGSPALFTGLLKEHRVTVVHQVTTVRQARGAEAQGVDIVIAEGFEGGGLRGPDRVSTMVLVPQIVTSVNLPVIASGGIVDSRGFVATAALGAQGVQMGSRFAATKECISHRNFKEALVAAIDSGTVVVGGQRWPTRVLKQGIALRLQDWKPSGAPDDVAAWDEELGMDRTRSAMIEGDLDSGVAYTGAGAGLISEVLTVQEVFNELLEGTQRIGKRLV